MQRVATGCLVLTLVGTAVPGLAQDRPLSPRAGAQQLAGSFDELGHLVKPGDTVTVTPRKRIRD